MQSSLTPAPLSIRRRRRAWIPILESVELREANHRGQAVIVSGCLPQRFRDELPTLMPEVDAFMGIDQVAQVGDIVGRAVAKRAEKSLAGAPAKGSKTKIGQPASPNWRKTASPAGRRR